MIIIEVFEERKVIMKSRVFHIVQQVKHPKTGEVLLDEAKIIDGLAHKTIQKHMYILHDKDPYTEDDEASKPTHVAGTKKADHWHIVINTGTNFMDTSTISKWFGVPEQFIDCPKGRNAFLDCAMYLTHEDSKQQELGKHLYDDSEIKANFDFRKDLNAYMDKKLNGKNLSERDQLRSDVLYNGVSLREARDKYPDLYIKDFAYLEKCRTRYLNEIADLPIMRMNFYISGDAGTGKDLYSKALARALIDKDGVMRDDDIFFTIGADNVTFEGYDGQPVVIWSDCRARTLLDRLGSRGNLFNVFDTTPQNIRQHVKFNSVRLINTINIVNSVETPDKFFENLTAPYKDNKGVSHAGEDKNQGYRRIPMFMILHESDYDICINSGFYNGTREYDQYTMISKVQGSMKRIAERFSNNPEARSLYERKMVSPIVGYNNEIQSRRLSMNNDDIAPDDKTYFESFGTRGDDSVDVVRNYEALKEDAIDRTEYLKTKNILCEIEALKNPAYLDDILKFAEQVKKGEITKAGYGHMMYGLKDYELEQKLKSIDNDNGFDPYAAYDPNAMM